MFQLILDSALFPLALPGMLIGLIILLAANFIPGLLNPYKLPMQLAGALILLFSTFQYGRYNEHQSYETGQLKAEVKTKETEVKAGEVTVKTITKYVDKIQYIDKVRTEYVYVDKWITPEDDARCVINAGFVRLHNSAAKAEVPAAAGATDAEATGVKLSTVAETVTGNYTQYAKVKVQLESLQQWVLDQKELWDKEK